jgi:hypothetical protein
MPTLELLPNRVLISPAERYMPVLTDKADMPIASPLKLTRCAYPTEMKQQKNKTKKRLCAKVFFMVFWLIFCRSIRIFVANIAKIDHFIINAQFVQYI